MHQHPQQFTPVYAAPIRHQHHHNPVNLLQQSVSQQPYISPSQREDPINCINKEMAFLSIVASRFPSSNNQLITSSNPRNQATIQDGRVTGKGIRQNSALSQRGQEILHGLRRSRSFQTKDLDAYDLDYDDISSAKAVLMANLLSCDSDVLFEVPYFDTYLIDMITEDVQEMSFDKVVKQRTTPDDISAEIVHIAVNFVDILDVSKSCVNECNKCLELKIELLKKKDLIEKDVYDKLFKSYSTLEKHCISLELETQFNQEIFQKDNSDENQNAPTFNQLFEINELKDQSQEKDTVIRKLKDMIKYLSGKDSVEKLKKDIDEIETINIELEHRVKCSTGASGSKPSDNTKNNRISQSSCSNKTNKVEDQSKSVKSKKNKKNHVVKTECLKDQVLVVASKIIPKLKYQKDHLCSACALGISKKHSHKPKAKDSIQEKLYLLHMDLCGAMRIQSSNVRKYILVIVDDYFWFTWVKFLRSKDEVPEFVIKFLKMIQVRLNAIVRNINTVEEGVDHDIEVAHMDNNPHVDFPMLEPSYEESSSRVVIRNNVYSVNQPPKYINKWTKDHLIDNVIDDPSRPVSTRHQLQNEALLCYFDAFLSSVEPKSYKEALIESCWIKAMQEELNKFEYLKV
ncbi:retrovirus-related pol polyprotein from transposon TNT 1-94 [Tanacetum coccineum]